MPTGINREGNGRGGEVPLCMVGKGEGAGE